MPAGQGGPESKAGLVLCQKHSLISMVLFGIVREAKTAPEPTAARQLTSGTPQSSTRSLGKASTQSEQDLILNGTLGITGPNMQKRCLQRTINANNF